MKAEQEKMLCHRWAELRFSVVGGLLSSPPEPGKLQEALRALTQKEWIHPRTGEPVRFGFSTIEAWYYQAKESDNPIEALRTSERRDAGEGRALGPELTAALKRQYALHPGWSYDLHHENLEVIAKSDLEKYGDASSYSTVRRRMRALGLTKKKRPRHPKPGQILAVERLEKREVRSFEMTHVGALSHLDFHNGSLKVVDAAGGWHTPECFASLDDYSRLCLHCQWYLEEETETLVHGFNQALMNGKWVPAYAFVFHEYVNNFQGNQVETTEVLSTEQGANHLLLRTAHSFTAGDLMTIVLTEEGEIHWAWCTKFSVPVPDQESIITLIRNLTAWRKGAAHEALVYGRMEKPFPILDGEAADVHCKDESVLKFDKVLTSRFLTEEGGDVQLLVNWQETPQLITVSLPEEIEHVSLISDSSGAKETVDVVAQCITVEVPPLNALMLEL